MDRRAAIRKLGAWLGRFPYENLTKRESASPRDPGIILEERERLGAGGTCFSLVNLAAEEARKRGLQPRFYLGERPDGPDRHCVLGFPDQGLFLDPGYLCFEPLPLDPPEGFHLVRPHNILHLEPDGFDALRVSTERKGQRTWRYTLRTSPAGRDRFERAWVDSFQWESVMNSVVLTRLRDRDMLCYLNGRLESVSRQERSSLRAPPEMEDSRYLGNLFGINPDLIEEWELTID